jgi:glucose/arabinose dehydrogenase
MKKLLLLIFPLFILVFNAIAQFQVGSVTVTPSVLTTNLQVPWELIWGPDNFIWMTERYGRISRVNPMNGQVIPLITIPDVLQIGESGLLGMVLHPNFNQNPYAYVAYTYFTNGIRKEKLVRYTYNGTALASPLVLLDNIIAASIHDGSRLLILPDNTLLMTTGDGSDTSRAQNPNSLNGKILRLNLDGTVPTNNPVSGSYVYTFGHRNAQGLVQAPNGKIYSSEHGPTTDDELNVIDASRNYGWPSVMGFCNTVAEQSFCNANNVKEPLVAWTPTLAVAGIAFYNNNAIPDWQNSVLLTSLRGEKFVQIKLNNTGTAVISQNIYMNGTYGRLRSICVSPSGKVYIGTSNQDGRGNPTTLDDRIIVLENLATNTTNINKTTEENKTFTAITDHTRKLIHLKFPSDHLAETVTLYNLSGSKILEKTISQNLEVELQVGNLRGGIYLIRAGKAVQKVILY